MMNCDVFIGYRRDDGDMTAMHIYQALKLHFPDVHRHRSGLLRQRRHHGYVPQLRPVRRAREIGRARPLPSAGYDIYCQGT